jgi:hypothetical protein
VIRAFLLVLPLAACVGSIDAPSGPIGSLMGPGTPTNPGSPPEMIPAFAPAPLQGRLLLSWHYTNAIRDVLGPEAAAAAQPPTDIVINGLSAIASSQLSLSTSSVQDYETSSYAVAQAALATAAQRQALYGCTPAAATDDVCFAKFLSTTGKRLLRRDLTADEQASWLAVHHAASDAYGDFDKGVEFVLAGLLQSPSFLYRFEVGTPDPSDSTRVVLTPNELATRLSFFLAGTTPSDALLAAAASGGLDSLDGIRAQAMALLALPSARGALLALFDEVLELQGLDTLSKDSTAFPAFDPAITTSMREETHRLLADVAFDTGGDFRTVLDADYTFVDSKLAALYGLPAPTSPWQRVTLDPSLPRLGMLGEGAYLALQAHPANTSPTHRGKLIREQLLCEPVAAPPANVNTTLPADPPGMTTTLRQKMTAHVSNPSCATCHKLMDPLGFAFESFDSTGAYRTTDNGQPVDTTGALDGQGFANARGLMGLLKDDPRVARCLTKTVYRQAAGHVELLSETAPLRTAEQGFKDSNYSLKELMVQLATSDAFRYGRAP